MLIDNYQVSWNHSVNMISKSVTDKEESKRTISQCLITKITATDSPLVDDTIERFTAIFITDSEYQFNRKHAILESFKMAVGQIKERVERTKLWEKFWSIRKKKTIEIKPVLIDNREERLLSFLETNAIRDIKGDFIVYSLKEVDVHFKR